MNNPTKVIDLFAGSGGLGEGFSSYRPDCKQKFKIAISIEKERNAHRTLLLRSLFRQFEHKEIPESYYAFLRGELGANPEDELYHLPEFKAALVDAHREAQQLTLGETSPQTIYRKIRDVIGNDECVLIGGPPCQAYSLVGRARNSGAKDKVYSAKEDHRNFLYQEYLKVIAKFQPKVFVMENVKGILSAKIDGKLIFTSIIKDLQNPHTATKVLPDSGRKQHNYKIFSLNAVKEGSGLIEETEESLNPHDYIIRTESLGIPQTRHRVIILGVRDDIASDLGAFERLNLSDENPTVKNVISDLPKLRSRLSKGDDTVAKWRQSIVSISEQTVNKLSEDPLVPDSVYVAFTKELNGIHTSPSSTGANHGQVKKTPNFDKDIPVELQKWFEDSRLGKYVINHESRGHIVGDLHRYLYYSSYAKTINQSPNAKNLPKILWPKHKNFKTGKFADRFRVQMSKKPGTTVTCHISKDGHYFIHYDPNQCRSLTVREVARIQTFPDNYYFVGNRTQQYVQVGNAVPPYLAKQIAAVVEGILSNK